MPHASRTLDLSARNVRMDYTPVEVNGRTYWTR